MYFRQFFDPQTSAMSYLFAPAEAAAAVAVDPNPDPCQALLLQSLLAERRFELRMILLTHVHGDMLERLAHLYPAVPLVAGAPPGGGERYRAAGDGDTLLVGAEAIRVIATPGHTPVSVSYLWQDRLFCGDALELGGCGLAEGEVCDAGRIYDSVVHRLFTLPDEVLVFPGHDVHGRTVSTIGEERQRNPFFLPRSRDAFMTAFRERQRPKSAGFRFDSQSL